MAEKYITKSDVINHLQKIQNDKLVDSDYRKFAWGMEIFIDGLPSANIEPVKHGYWITSEFTMDSGCTSCSCCRSEYYIGDLQNLEGDNDFVMYCLNCGAKMDRGEIKNV